MRLARVAMSALFILAFSIFLGDSLGATRTVSAKRALIMGVTSDHYDTVTTTDTTTTLLVQTNIPEDSVQHVRGRVLARNTSTGDSKAWDISFMAKRVGNGNATIVGAVVTVFMQGDVAMATAAVIGDTSSDQVRIRVIGILSTTIDWYGEYQGLQLYP